jgi:hypothetical protein
MNKKNVRTQENIIINWIPVQNIFEHNSNITIKAFAAENEIQLSKDLISFKLNAVPINGAIDSVHSYINYNLYFKCEGENIKTITYTCSDQKINRYNRSTANAYYVENISVPVDDFSKEIKADNCIYGGYGEGEDLASITKLIGNTYTVDYHNQADKQYGIVLAATVDEKGTYKVYSTKIKVDITLKDGSIQHKDLQIISSEDVFSEIQMRIL